MMQSLSIPAAEPVEMLKHWLSSPAGGYLGQSYGNEVQALIHDPLRAGGADLQIRKMREDIPLLNSIEVNIYAADINGVDQQALVFDVAGQVLTVQGG
jgi:hypothetical protein